MALLDKTHYEDAEELTKIINADDDLHLNLTDLFDFYCENLGYNPEEFTFELKIIPKGEQYD